MHLHLLGGALAQAVDACHVDLGVGLALRDDGHRLVVSVLDLAAVRGALDLDVRGHALLVLDLHLLVLLVLLVPDG